MGSTAILLHLSDLHFGKETSEYSSTVAAKRLDGIPAQIKAEKPPERVLVLLNGDLVEGEGIFPHQEAVNGDHARDQVNDCAHSLARLARGLHKRWPRALVRIVVVRGNHGRLSKTAHPESSLDLMVGDALYLHLKGEAWCQVAVERGVAHVEDVCGKRVVAMHRAEKGAGTNAGYGRVARRLRHYGADVLLAGHWHEGAVYERDGQVLYVVNGSLCGPDEYSEQLGAYDPPMQSVLYFGPRGLEDVQWLRW